MQELSFNDACGKAPFSDSEQALQAVSSISTGIANLIAAGVAEKVLRLSAPVTDIFLTTELTLFDTMLHLTKDPSTRDEGAFLQSLVQKVPLENDLEDEGFERVATWELNDFPGCMGLLLCAVSNRLAVSATENTYWHSDFLEVSCRIDEASPSEARMIGNIFSADTSGLKKHYLAIGIDEKSPLDLWNGRNELFPNLKFAPSVQRNLRSLGATQYKLAVAKLTQLNDSASEWSGRPNYQVEIRSESESTMNKYGKLRKFQDEHGNTQTYILHLTVTDGFRAHIRELPEDRLIEVGYIGPHLKVASEN